MNCPRRYILTKQEALLNRGAGGEQRGKETRESCSAILLTFYVKGECL